ncbi:MAG TPA: hypothetical protein VGM81_16930 [Burkholderiaceae bacterium]|jgi:hypothetical protein
MNESLMRLWTLVTVGFAVSTALWLAGMVQAQQSDGMELVQAHVPRVHLAAAAKPRALFNVEVAARSAEQAASAALNYAANLR